jgi:TusA-related sulfurtransferase
MKKEIRNKSKDIDPNEIVKLVSDDGQSKKLEDTETIIKKSKAKPLFSKNVNDESERGWD